MKWGRRVFFILLACGVVGVLALVWPGEREPVYQGRTLSQWVLADLQQQAQSSQDARAADAIRHIGTNALPFLVSWIQYHTPPVKLKVINALLVRGWGGGVVMHRLTRKENLANSADHVFEILGAEGRPAIPELARVMRKWELDVSTRTMFALRHLGEEGLVELLAVVTNSAVQPFARCSALSNIGMMGYLGTNANVAVPILVQCLKDQSYSVAASAAFALRELGLEAGVAVPALAASLQHADHRVRFAAGLALGEFKSRAAPAVDSLLKALDDPAAEVRSAATNALREIAPEVLETNRVR